MQPIAGLHRLFDLQDDIGRCVDRSGIGDNGGTGLPVSGVGVQGAGAGLFFDVHFEPELAKLGGRLGNGRHPVFAWHDLFGYSDHHRSPLSLKWFILESRRGTALSFDRLRHTGQTCRRGS